MKNLLFAIIAVVPFFTASVQADEPFAIQGDQVLTQEELDAAFNRIPEVHRLAFIRDGARVDQLVTNLLKTRQVAAAAREAGFDQNPIVHNRMALAAEKELAEAWLIDVMNNAPEADYEALAMEYYLSNPEKFQTEEMLDVSHILISSENRPEEEALEIAIDVRERLVDNPALFADLVEEYSEDPAKANNGGRYPNMKKGQMVPNFERAAYALEEAGELTEPVRTSYGFHIIRLNGKLPSRPVPFEAVKDQLMAQEKKEYLLEYRNRYIERTASQPIEIEEGAVEVMAKRYFGENLELAPTFQE
jgi:peptidyl-prolyl cis-trans isomerase C